VKRSWLIWIGLGIIVIVAGVLLVQTLVAYFNGSDPEQMASEIEIQQAVARQGTLTLSVNGSGEYVASDEVELGFQENGQLVALNVNVGDQVLEGDVLAQLKIDQTPAELAANVTNAELEVLRAQNNIDQYYENAEIAAAQALLALEEAQLVLESLEHYDLEMALAEQELRLAEDTVQEAEMKLYIVNSSPSQAAVDTAYASLLFKEKELDEIKDQLAQAELQFKSAPNEAARDRLNQQILTLRARLANQQLEYENALYKYNTMDDPPENNELTVAETQLATAQAQLAEAKEKWETAQAGPANGDLAMADAQLAAAQAEWERVKDGPGSNEIQLAEAALAKAEAELKLIEAGELILDLVSPIDGTVLSIDAHVGDRIEDQIILTLADLSQPIVEVYLDEIDSANVQVGDRAEINFDAIPERTFSGQVVEVDSELRRVGNTQGVRALVLLDEPPNNLVNLPLGLNAAVDIIAEEAANTVLVMIEAIEQDADGGDIVYVIDGDQVETRLIHVGLKDATTAEVTTGLEPGERVAIGGMNFTQE
jgi:multidrug efflux pump subunit AcrA (membrane-fusion protein)